MPSENQNSDTFVPRPNLSREIAYRGHLKGFYYGSFVIAGVSAAIGLSYLVYILVRHPEIDWSALLTTLVVVPCGFLALARGNLRHQAFTRVAVRPEGLRVIGPRPVEIEFRNLERADITFIPYLGGRCRLVDRDKKTFQFDVALERSEYILENLIQARPELLSLEKFLHFRRTAIVTDHSWARIGDRLRFQRVILAFLFLSLPFLGGAALTLWMRTQAPAEPLVTLVLTSFLSAFFVNFLVGLSTWGLADIAMLWREGEALRKNPNLVRRNVPFENRIYHFSALAHVAFFGLALWLFA